MNGRCWLLYLMIVNLSAACSGSEPAQTPTRTQPWIEEEITFTSGPNELFGILTLPNGDGPFPAIALISGSVNTTTGARSGVDSRYFIDHAHKLALNGYVVLRYDPPGVGRSSGASSFESLEVRADEAIAAVRYLQSRPDIIADGIGLHGNSQGAWVNALAAAVRPEDVAFIINVSGAGMSVAEQQVYSVEAQSKEAGFSDEDITKAVLFGRLLVDWQLTNPIYTEVNTADAELLGAGPWADFMSLVYEPGDRSPADAFQEGIDILKSVQGEPWTEFLYLEELYIPLMESVPQEQVEALKALTGPNLIGDPAEYFTQVTSPVLAFFGEEDLLQPTERSAALYEKHLTEAGNQDFAIVVLPEVDHNIVLTTPGYWNAMTEWLDGLDLE